MEEVSWRDRRMNEEVLYVVGEKRCLMETIGKWKVWNGNVFRGGGRLRDVMERRLVERDPRTDEIGND
jgi:hypothetical protein